MNDTKKNHAQRYVIFKNQKKFCTWLNIAWCWKKQYNQCVKPKKNKRTDAKKTLGKEILFIFFDRRKKLKNLVPIKKTKKFFLF